MPGIIIRKCCINKLNKQEHKKADTSEYRFWSLGVFHDWEKEVLVKG